MQADSHWCFPVEWATKKSLRSIVKEYGTSKSKAKKLQRWVKENFSAEAQYNKFTDSISQMENSETFSSQPVIL